MSAPEKKSESKTTAKADKAASAFRIPSGSSWQNAWKIFAGIGVVGLAGAAAGYNADATRFAYSYLFAFFLVLTVGLGSLFFILVERLTAASWSVSVRRTAEFFGAGMPVFLVLFLPVLLCMGTLYPWLNGKDNASVVESEAHAQEAPPPGAQNARNTEPGTEISPAPQPPGRAPMPGGGHGPMPGFAPPRHGAGMPGGHPGMIPPPGMHAEQGGEGEGPEAAEFKELMEKKHGWLNKNGWMARAFLYLLVWSWIGTTFFKFSTSQDGTKDMKLTVKAQKYAPVATLLFGYTLTGAALDWLMSLLPSWYSTMFGVTIFAGSVVVMYATLIVVTMAMREAGLVKDAINVEHYHDLGKLLFGFIVFWAYTSFAQYMLIWYAGIPEEATFYHHRWEVGSWTTISLGIVFCHFVIPFFLLVSRNEKRKLGFLRVGALWMIVMHAVEMYWFVLPYFGKGIVSFSWIDASCLFGIAGVYLAVVFRGMTKHPLIPVGDPRLARSLAFENA